MAYVVERAVLLWAALSFGTASADVILDVTGTPSSPTITASVVGSDVFQSGTGGCVKFHLLPNVFEIHVGVEGPLGGINPWIVRAPADGSYLNLIRICSGDLSSFELDATSPISSSMVVGGNIQDLAALDGVTSFMATSTVGGATGPATNVTLNYELCGDTSLTTQAEVDAFECTTVVGRLVIDGPSITNLDALSSLTSIGGDLMLGNNNDGLADLDGLSALASIGGGLDIQQNSALADLDGLSALVSVGANVTIADNPQLVECCGLFSLLSGGGVIGEISLSNNGGGCESEQDIIDGCESPVAVEKATWAGLKSRYR